MSSSTNLSFIGLGRFRGHWNASTNVALSGGTLFTGSHISGGYNNGNLNLTATPFIGEYWQVNTAGTTNLNGTNSWQVSDFCVYTTGSKWVKIANSDVISSIVVGDIDTSALHSSLLVSSSNQQVLFNSGSIISGSQNFTFDYAAGIMRLSGSLLLSGTLVANEFKTNVVTQNVVNISSTGSTSFGNSVDDNHHFSGSMRIYSQASDGLQISGTFSVSGSTSLNNAVTINDSANDRDFRVESTSNPNMLFVDASHNRVGIGVQNPFTELHLDGKMSIKTGSDPGTQAGSANLYAKNISGVAELVAQDSAGNRVNLTQLNRQIDMDDNLAESFVFQQSVNKYLVFDTTNGSEQIEVNKTLAINALTAHSGNVLIRSGSYLTVTSNATDTASMFFVRSDSGVQIGGGYDSDGLTFDSTGSLKTSGSILISYQTGHRPAHHVRGPRAFTGVNTTDNGTGGTTLTPAVLVDGVYFATNKGGGVTDTTATAAQIQAAFGNDIRNGDSFTFYYYNLGANPVTLNGGSRVTTAALNATASYTMSASKGRGFIITATDVTPGNEHCIMFPTTDLFNALS